MQPDFAVGIMDALGVQQLVEPGQAAALGRAASVAVVTVKKAQRSAFIE